MRHTHGGVDGDVAIKFEQSAFARLRRGRRLAPQRRDAKIRRRLIRHFRGCKEQRFECAHGIAHQRPVAQPVWIQRTQAAVNFRQCDMRIVTIHRQISRQRSGRGVFHELGIKRAADAHGGEAVLVNQLSQCNRGLRLPMGAEAGKDINHIRFSRLQPERVL